MFPGGFLYNIYLGIDNGFLKYIPGFIYGRYEDSENISYKMFNTIFKLEIKCLQSWKNGLALEDTDIFN